MKYPALAKFLDGSQLAVLVDDTGLHKGVFVISFPGSIDRVFVRVTPAEVLTYMEVEPARLAAELAALTSRAPTPGDAYRALCKVTKALGKRNAAERRAAIKHTRKQMKNRRKR